MGELGRPDVIRKSAARSHSAMTASQCEPSPSPRTAAARALLGLEGDDRPLVAPTAGPGAFRRRRGASGTNVAANTPYSHPVRAHAFAPPVSTVVRQVPVLPWQTQMRGHSEPQPLAVQVRRHGCVTPSHSCCCLTPR